METSMEGGPVRELSVVGGHLALDFANTVDDPDGPAHHDHLATYQGLLEWSVAIGTLTSEDARRLQQAAASRPQDEAAALQRVHVLREMIAATFTAVAANRSSVTRHWVDLRPFVTDALAHAELAPSDTAYEPRWPVTDQLDAVVWPVAHAAAGLLTGPLLHRVKCCAACPWLFVDRSRNGSRRWCTMEVCGTHAKMRRYVALRAARRTGALGASDDRA